MTRGQKILIYLILVIALVGILDAGFLVYEHYTGKVPPCTVFNGCDVVTSSRYAVILGVPVSLLGLCYYIYVFGVVLAILDKKLLAGLKFLFYPAAGAFLFSLYLVSIQVFTLKSLCAYCMLSALNSTLIFAFVFFLRRLSRRFTP
ncbi:MAG: vitamin K epoxide reductase family protein [Patescibacteria group bacterium]|nr:vitamin K epoxide reductase family protein [Patescibacteria group bacterium]